MLDLSAAVSPLPYRALLAPLGLLAGFGLACSSPAASAGGPSAGAAGAGGLAGGQPNGGAGSPDLGAGGAQLAGAAGSGGSVAVVVAGSGGSGTAGSGAGPVDPSQAEPCAPARPHAPGTTTVNLTFDGQPRDYVLHVPKGYDGTKALPVVVDLHGYTSWATEQLQRSKWDSKADSEGFILVEPDGTHEGGGESRSWNVEVCCGVAQQQNVDDVGFIREVVDQVKTELCVDAKRIYATGHSNGAAMTFLLACQAADIFAAVAPVCGATNQPGSCQPSRPIPVAMIRTKDDGAVPYEGKPNWPSAAADLALWQGLNQCATTPVVASQNGVCEAYPQCAAGTSVMLCSPRGGHAFFYNPDENPDQLLVPDTAWPFFKQFSLP